MPDEQRNTGRDAAGRWLPGTVTNPRGRVPMPAEFRKAAQSYSMEALETLVDLMRHSESDSVRGAAAQQILDRSYGKPPPADPESIRTIRDVRDMSDSDIDTMLASLGVNVPGEALAQLAAVVSAAPAAPDEPAPPQAEEGR